MVAPGPDPIPIDTARDQLAAAIKPIDDIERVTLSAARGRIAVETVISQIDLPATHNAAVDGYGVHAASFCAQRLVALWKQESRVVRQVLRASP